MSAVTAETATAVERAGSVKGPLLVTVAILLVFFGIFGGWAALVPLSGAAIAPAVVAPDGFRKTIQHLEGGIVSQLRVREGSTVEAGDVLVVLDDVRTRAEYNTARARLAASLAKAARLTAEQQGADTAVFPPELLAQAEEDAAVRALTDAERDSLVARRQSLVDQLAMRDGKVAQAKADLVAYEGSLASIDRQIELISEEEATVVDLVQKGLDRKPRLLALQRARADLDGQRNTAVANAARTRALIAATMTERQALISGRAEEVATGLADARASANELEEAVQAASDRLQRTVIKAPVAGEVVDLKLRTLGGVVTPGEPIMDLVPRDEPLVIEARVSPKDIDVVHAGLPADIHLTAYHTRHMPRITGEVRQVSADRLTDAKTGEPYYTAEILVDMAKVRLKTPEVHLTAGMPAEAMIITGQRTAFEYLIEPIKNSFRRSLRET